MIGVAWALLVLGGIHIVFGLARFKTPLTQAWTDGFIGQFDVSEARRSAFWFLMAGPLLMALGHTAIYAAETGNQGVFTAIGLYMLVPSAIGVAAFPRSPLWASLVLSLGFLATGFGWIG